jgi:thiol-disulfide isomerase/thioredoxin
MVLRRVFAGVVSWAVLLAAAGGQPPPPAGKSAADEFVNVAGGKYRLPGPDDAVAVVLLFVGHDCPISNGYAPEVGRVCKEYTPKRVAFCVVYADADLTRDAARKHAEEYGYTCPAVLDPEMKLARMVGATVKPEAAVLSPAGELVYRGRIDDLYPAVGKKRPRPTTRDLRDALDAVLAGKPVPVARTKAVGCDIDFPAKDK